jgi:SAM-dependent methyltransferase
MTAAQTVTKPMSSKISVDEMIPPESMDFVGGNFKAVGLQFLNYFVDLCGLKPHESVLDVGCGIGRMAIPLTQYLNSEARFEGFDIVPMGIDWCNEKVTPHYPNFRFQLANIYNKHYNPTGTWESSKYRFPYADSSFDFVFLTSVFTHMLSDEVDNYLKEISRVLKKDGRCLATIFLLNSESLALIDHKKSSQNLQHQLGKCRVWSLDVPETSIGHDEGDALGRFAAHGLEVQQPIRYGNWCGRENAFGYQDIILARKRGTGVPKKWWGRLIAGLR